MEGIVFLNKGKISSDFIEKGNRKQERRKDCNSVSYFFSRNKQEELAAAGGNPYVLKEAAAVCKSF